MTPPRGYVLLHVGGARAIVRGDAADAVHRVLAANTLHAFGAAHPERRELRGRASAYAVPLHDGLRIVVRHNVHGGMLARLTGDRFLSPTRAPLELQSALRLAEAGVPTPPVVAIVRYPAGGPLERADVATEEVAPAADLAHVMLQEPALHTAAAAATGTLLRLLRHAGARHADLNIKNVLLQRTGTGLQAYLLDVDRVSFERPGSSAVAEMNWSRFARSAHKWRMKHGAPISESWLETVRHAAGLS